MFTLFASRLDLVVTWGRAYGTAWCRGGWAGRPDCRQGWGPADGSELWVTGVWALSLRPSSTWRGPGLAVTWRAFE